MICNASLFNGSKYRVRMFAYQRLSVGSLSLMSMHICIISVQWYINKKCGKYSGTDFYVLEFQEGNRPIWRLSVSSGKSLEEIQYLRHLTFFQIFVFTPQVGWIVHIWMYPDVLTLAFSFAIFPKACEFFRIEIEKVKEQTICSFNDTVQMTKQLWSLNFRQ